MAENATVRVVINALTEAAEQSIDEVGDEISELSGDAAIGQAGLDQLSDEFGEATAQSMILQSALDQLSDEVSEVGNSSLYAQTAMDQFNDEIMETTTSSAIASGALSGLSTSMSGSTVASSALSGVMKLSLIPALLTLATIIAPLVATFAVLTAGAFALAGAFGAIVGSGILAFGKERAKQNKKELRQTKRLIAQYQALRKQTGSLTRAQQDRLEQLKKKKKRLEESTTVMGALQSAMSDLKDELMPLIVQFGKEFIPLIEDALNAVPTLVERMIAAVGSTEQFREALRDFGRASMKIIPALTAAMFTLARKALPVARELFTWLMKNGPDAWKAIMANVKELEPELRNLLDAMIEMAPVLLNFGTNVAEFVIPILTELIKLGTDFMAWVNGMKEGSQQATIALMILLPVILKLVGALSSILQFFTGTGILGNLARLIVYFSSASSVTGAFANAASWLAGALSTLTSILFGTLGGLIVVGTVVGLIVTKLLMMIGVMEKVGEAGKSLGEFLGPGLTSILLTLATVLTAGLLPVIAAVGAAIVQLLQGDIPGAIAAFHEVLGIFATAFKNFGKLVLAGFKYIASIIARYLGNSIIPEMIRSGLNEIFNTFVLFFIKRIPKAIKRGIKAIMKAVGQLGNPLDPILNTLKDIYQWAVRTIKKLKKVSSVNLPDAPNVGNPFTFKHLRGVDNMAPNVGNPFTFKHLRGVDDAVAGAGNTVENVINGGVQIDVDAAANLADNPYDWSREAGQQLQREIRQQFGSDIL